MSAQLNQAGGQSLAGVMGVFNDAHTLVEATRQVREAKYPHFEPYTPFPVHGLDAAQGLKRSPLPFVTFAAGLTGGICGFGLQYWTSAIDWAVNVAGKPFNSWPAFVPVMFETTVLFAGLATAGSMILLFNRLPNTTKKSFDARITNDKFALVIEAPTGLEADELADLSRQGFKSFNEGEATALLKSLGATEVRTVYNEGWF